MFQLSNVVIEHKQVADLLRVVSYEIENEFVFNYVQ
jgi:hypothetical protein